MAARKCDMRVMAYDVFLTLHVLGLVLLLGNVTVTSIWKVFADRGRNPVIIAHAQRLVTITDWFCTGVGILLLTIGGFGAAYVAGIDPFGADWLVHAELLFLLSGCLWLFILVPIQTRQARMARGFANGGPIPEAYWREARRWIFWGLVATVPLVAATWVMIAKP